MNQKSPNPLFRRLAIPAVCALAVALLSSPALARPYATSLTNSLTSISFRLNEDADNVKIISLGGAVTNDLGPLPKGLTVTNLVIAGVFKVQVTKSAGPGYVQGVVNQISVDTNNFVKFVNQRGVSVNKNTNSPYFGRIYVSVSAPGTTAGRSVADGIYLLNADQTDAIGQGDTPRTGGVNGGAGFDAFVANAESPNRIVVGPDDNLYITDWSDAHGGLYVTDPNVATNAAATHVLPFLGGPSATTNNHGSMSAVWIEGSLAQGNLVVYTQDEDLVPKNGVWRYDIGAGPLPYAADGTLAFSFGLNSQYSDLVRGPDGKWYGSNRRAEFATSAGVFVLSEDGSTVLWNSLSVWREFSGNPTARDSYFGETRGLDVSPDGKYLVVFRGATNNPVAPFIPPFVAANSVLILPLDNGVPNITNLVVMPTAPFTATGRDVSFDAVGNIYTVSSGQGLLRIYSPGGFSIVTTGSDGTLEMFVPQMDVGVAATDNAASEIAAERGEFTITRASPDLSQPLTVRFAMTGTATNGVDYVLQTNSVTLTTNVVVIPAGADNVVVSLVATDDAVAEFTETARLGVTPSDAYTVISQPATVTIEDNETPSIDIEAAQSTVFEANVFDYARFQLIRRGRTNDGPLSIEIHNAGATARYVAAGPVNIDPGVVNQTFDVNPVNDALLNGNGTISLTVSNGTGYTVGVITPTATATIVDDEVASAPILFADNFSGDPSTNWVVRFGSGNGIDDFRINEQVITLPTTPYDYSAEGIPAAPNGNDTLGLKVTVNKDEATALGGAGINLYPIGRSFSGDYALRFDMYTILNTASTTEQVLFGINHSASQTNWFRSSNNGFTNSAYDGLWTVIVTDSSGLGTFNGNAPSGDYILVSAPQTNRAGIWGPTVLANRDADSFVDTFKNPPWGVAGLPGVPSNPNVTATPGWAQVELSQIGNLVTLKINNTFIFSVANIGAFQSGNIMLGYSDSYDSIGGVGAVIYDNVRVVGLTQPKLTITSAARSGTTTVLNFTWTTDEPVSAFTVWKATNVTGTYTTAPATIVKLSPGVYQATLTGQTDSAAFYRISH